MKKLLTTYLQKLANYLISKLEVSSDEKEFNFWLSQSYQLLSYCTMLDIELE